MTDHEISSILQQLYEIDPSLRSREAELTKIIRTLSLTPRVPHDPAFAAELRARILSTLALQRAPWAVAHPRGMRAAAGAFLDILRRHRALATGIGALAVIVAAAGAFALRPGTGAPSSPLSSGSGVALLAPSVTIDRVNDHAFGVLSSAPAGGAAEPMAAPMMGAAVMGVRPIASPPTIAQEASYTYTGASFSQNHASLDVLKVVPVSLDGSQAAAALAQAGFGAVDLGTFPDLGMTSVTLDEHHAFGHEISVDLANGTVSIGENYAEWPQGSPTPLTTAQVPSDASLIAIANGFLAAHHFSTSSFGAPTVTSPSSLAAYPEAQATAGTGGGATGSAVRAMPMIPYYPDSVQVFYPLIVNDMPVYRSDGSPVGMTLEVNVRYGRVANAYGIEVRHYEASSYPAITSTSTILSMAEHMQPSPIIYDGAMGAGASATASIGMPGSALSYLETPSMVYLDTFEPDTRGTSQEYLIPAFAFPVSDAQGGSPSRDVIVPLIQEFAQGNRPLIVPLR